MSRKDYQLIAKTLKENGASFTLVSAMADALAGTNPRFDRWKFISAATNETLTLVRKAE